ncbi:uridine diphosphate-N-acetylglucosamine-binding protein YvcK [Alloacidobacterium dinghuense]|uniref:Putative gluconeogenesis factor n=1 Tax=Alloacidobacterium dinghuense TaxID=2763107 RepID=A0A7G8BCQ2_9BACT|nr:uridine diphosphate-N-acetylglucosamine-binding protein YvcK [Alloacidobacterium dinghuense]QNI30322.1 uridine diphosphate-N-acetylglucosamine-binding protein YvcK [Alloacidobacterium dinghuense]
MKQATLAPSHSSPPNAEKVNLRVVAMGGGTGLSTLLRGFKRYVPSPGATQPEYDDYPCLISHLAAVVTVTDDGGSSGRLRKDFNMLPPGDLRNCMVALSEDEHLISRLFRHRFRSGAGLEGHSFGNLFVAALSEMTGDAAQAIRLAAEILATRGHIYPATTADVSLAALMDDGETVRGETNITASKKQIVELTMEPPDAEPMPETLEAIERADLVTIGPGSLYTSLVTNLLVKGVPEALAHAQGLRVYVCNLMTQANESLHLTASEHIERIYDHAGGPIFDYAVINTGTISDEMIARYAAEGAEPIQPDIDGVEAMGIRCITGNFADEGDVLRHAADRVAARVLDLALYPQNGRRPNAG